MALDLEQLIGKWSMAASFDGAPPIEEQLASGAATVSFEWMAGKEFVIQRWAAPDLGPDGVAVIGADPESDGFLQHYFDQRGVARVYKMTLDSGEWKLWREEADFSPLSFSQRFAGTFTDDGNRIEGTWERTAEEGESQEVRSAEGKVVPVEEADAWIRDFDLVYGRVR